MKKEKINNNTMTEVERMVNDELMRMGFSYRNKGTAYLREAITLAVNIANPDEYCSKKNYGCLVSRRIAEKHNISLVTLSHAMNRSIDRAFLCGNIDYLLEILEEIYDYDKGKVSAMDFVTTVAKKINADVFKKQKCRLNQVRATIGDALENISDLSILVSIEKFVFSLEGGVNV